jgi:hypothetical protein
MPTHRRTQHTGHSLKNYLKGHSTWIRVLNAYAVFLQNQHLGSAQAFFALKRGEIGGDVSMCGPAPEGNDEGWLEMREEEDDGRDGTCSATRTGQQRGETDARWCTTARGRFVLWCARLAAPPRRWAAPALVVRARWRRRPLSLRPVATPAPELPRAPSMGWARLPEKVHEVMGRWWNGWRPEPIQIWRTLSQARLIRRPAG